ncbi:MAG TPA: ABC transporter permease [Burkholderiaceae bacterium]|nr:ABC transporter permease [Burkholderiaceae bacterium]
MKAGADPVSPGSSWVALDRAAGGARLRLIGRWRLANLAAIDRSLRRLQLPPELEVDGSALEEIDAAGALALTNGLRAAGIEPGRVTLTDFTDAQRRIIERVAATSASGTPLPRRRRPTPLSDFGRAAMAVGHLLRGHVAFFGAACAALAAAFLRPHRLRIKELVVQLEQTGLNAIPVVALVTLLIGIVVAYLLGLQAEKYGANIFVVDGVGIGATREFAPIIVAVIVAGRSGAAFTAQLGAMRLTEEIDAIRTLGLSPMQVLVVPRMLALVIALPLLVFIGDVMSILGAMWIAEPMLDITPKTFLNRLNSELAVRHVLVGLAKAPVFALFIALIGTRMGMTVERDTRAVGLATTSTVVQSIVAVILLDALFALLFQRIGI